MRRVIASLKPSACVRKRARVAKGSCHVNQRVMGWMLLILFGVSTGAAVVSANGQTTKPRENCTLEPTEGSKQAVLSKGIIGKTTWSACTSIVQDFIFEWPRKQGFPATSKEALQRATALLQEWRKATTMEAAVDGKFNYARGVSPFGDLAAAINKRAAESGPYIFGEKFAVTPENPGWDGAWVSLSSTTQTTQLTVHYWANP